MTYLLIGLLLFFVLIIAAVMMAILTGKLQNRSEGLSRLTCMNVCRKPLLTPNEAAFYVELRKIIPPGRDISCKCRLEDIMGIAANVSNRNSQRNRIKSRHVDFVVFDPLTGNVDYVIELDDSSHLTNKKQQEDQLKNMLFAQIGIILIRVKAKQRYDYMEVYQELIKYFGS